MHLKNKIKKKTPFYKNSKEQAKESHSNPIFLIPLQEKKRRMEEGIMEDKFKKKNIIIWIKNSVHEGYIQKERMSRNKNYVPDETWKIKQWGGEN